MAKINSALEVSQDGSSGSDVRSEQDQPLFIRRPRAESSYEIKTSIRILRNQKVPIMSNYRRDKGAERCGETGIGHTYPHRGRNLLTRFNYQTALARLSDRTKVLLQGICSKRRRCLCRQGVSSR